MPNNFFKEQKGEIMVREFFLSEQGAVDPNELELDPDPGLPVCYKFFLNN